MRIEPIHMKQNQLLHNVSHETIHIPDQLSTIFDWFQTRASYENLIKTTIHSMTPVLAAVPILQEKAFSLLTCFSFYKLKHCSVHLHTEEKELVFLHEVDMYIKKLVESAM